MSMGGGGKFEVVLQILPPSICRFHQALYTAISSHTQSSSISLLIFFISNSLYVLFEKVSVLCQATMKRA